MKNFEGFPCIICKKKVNEQFSYTKEFNETYGNLPCPNCGKISEYVVELSDNYYNVHGKSKVNNYFHDGPFKKHYISCLECNPIMDSDEIWYSDRVCCECFFEQKGKRSQSDLLTKLKKKNQELSKVQKQLAEVLEELKKVKNNSVGQNNEKLEQQIVQNEKLIKNSENISVSEVQEQVNKSQAVIKEFQNMSTKLPTKSNEVRKGNNSNLILGYLMVIVSILIIFMGGLLVGRRSKKLKS